MKYSKHLKNNYKIFNIKIKFYRALILAFLSILPAYVAAVCSDYAGQASLNEFFKNQSNQSYDVTDFVEVKILNGTINSTVFETWKLRICEDNEAGNNNDADGCSPEIPLSSFTNNTKPWLTINGTAVMGAPSVTIEVGKYINYKTGFDAVLLDNTNKIIDYVSVEGYSTQLSTYTGCSTNELPFDWQFTASGASAKFIFRSPDGIGDWDYKTSAVDVPSEDNTNDTGGTVGKSEWYMDELSWNSTPNEVTEQSTNLNHGTAYNGSTTVTPGKLCNAGSFDGVNDYIQIPHDTSLQGTSQLTYSAWINPTSWSGNIRQIMSKSVHGGGSGRAQMGIFSENGRLVGRAETVGSVRHEVFTDLPSTSNWTHVALVFNGNSLNLYINGALAPNADSSHRSSKTFSTTTLATNNDPLMISKRVGSNQYYFSGKIDEVLVFKTALQASFIQTMYTNYNNGFNWDGATRSCPGSLHHFEIRHDAFGLTCEPENIYVKACSDAACSSLYPTDVTITPSPAGTGATSWQPNPQIILANNEATLQLSHKTLLPSGATSQTLTLGISSSSTAPTDSNVICKDLLGNPGTCDITFYDSGFIYTMPTQISCETSATPITIRAVRKDLTTQQCVSLFTGPINNNINFTVSPAPTPDIVMNQGLPNEQTFTAAAATQTVNLSFNNSEATFTLTHNNAGQFTLDASHINGSLTMLGTTPVVVRPHSFFAEAVYDNAGTEVALNNTTSIGNPFWKSSNNFRLRLRGQCADNTVTTNYAPTDAELFVELAAPDQTIPGNHANLTIEGTNFISSYPAPSTPAWHPVSAKFNNGAITDGTNDYASAVFHEVGVLNLHVRDNNYFGTSIPEQTLNIGRFTPHHFDTTVEHGCSGSTFTYSGQPFRVTAVAMNNLAVPSSTLNYNGNFAKDTTISNAGDTTFFANNIIQGGTVATGGQFINGTGQTRLISSASPVTYTFTNKDTIPSVLTLHADDPDTALSSSTNEATTEIRSGRARLDNVFGSELTALTMPLSIEYYSDNSLIADTSDDGFTLNTEDSCSSYDATLAALTNYTANLQSGETVVTGAGAISAGLADIIFSAPGTGNEGSVNLLANNISNWLTYSWNVDCDNADGDDDITTGIDAGLCGPSAVASFGLYRGDDRVIYWREVF